MKRREFVAALCGAAAPLGALDDAEQRQRSAKELLGLQPDVILTSKYASNCFNASTNGQRSNCFCDRCRSGWQWFRQKPGAARR